jgi:hypothetical protein
VSIGAEELQELLGIKNILSKQDGKNEYDMGLTPILSVTGFLN